MARNPKTGSVDSNRDERNRFPAVWIFDDARVPVFPFISHCFLNPIVQVEIFSWNFVVLLSKRRIQGCGGAGLSHLLAVEC